MARNTGRRNVLRFAAIPLAGLAAATALAVYASPGEDTDRLSQAAEATLEAYGPAGAPQLDWPDNDAEGAKRSEPPERPVGEFVPQN